MRLLAVDSASPLPALALVELADAAPVSEEVEPLPPAAAEALVARLRALEARCAFGARDVDRVAVLSGPGSFTGLRAGSAFARGLARALGVPLVGVGTFAAASRCVPGGDLDLLLDALRGDVHRARRRGGALVEDAGPVTRERALEEAARESVPVRDLSAEPVLLAGAVASLAAAAGLEPGDVPRYGRASAAEEKLERRDERGRRAAGGAAP